MPQRTAARRTTAGIPSKNQRRDPNKRTAAVRSAVSVSPFDVLRRMRQRKVGEQSASSDTTGRENRRRQVAARRVNPRERWRAWAERLSSRLETGLATGLATSWPRVRRLTTLALRGVLTVAVAAGAVAVGRIVEAHVRRSPSFATQAVVVEGNSRLDADQVIAAAGLAVGKNVFDVSPEEAERALIAHPWIATASVTRRLPHTYQVAVQERDAVALLALDQMYLVAGDAAVFKVWEPGDPDELPVITGIDSDAFARDRLYRTSLLVNAVALLHDYRDAGLWRRAPIHEVHAEPDEGLTLYVGDQATAVRLHRPPFRQKLARLRRVFDELSAKRADAAYVYLDNQRRADRVTVRLR